MVFCLLLCGADLSPSSLQGELCVGGKTNHTAFSAPELGHLKYHMASLFTREKRQQKENNTHTHTNDGDEI